MKPEGSSCIMIMVDHISKFSFLKFNFLMSFLFIMLSAEPFSIVFQYSIKLFVEFWVKILGF